MSQCANLEISPKMRFGRIIESVEMLFWGLSSFFLTDLIPRSHLCLRSQERNEFPSASALLTSIWIGSSWFAGFGSKKYLKKLKFHHFVSHICIWGLFQKSVLVFDRFNERGLILGGFLFGWGGAYHDHPVMVNRKDPLQVITSPFFC